jgi:hypothetical protein
MMGLAAKCSRITAVLIAGSIIANGDEKGRSPALGFGLTPADPIEVCAPDGEREYLARLRCPDGGAPAYDRSRSQLRNPSETPEAAQAVHEQVVTRRQLRKGELDYHVVDAYQVSCRELVLEVFLDMYHCGASKPKRAPGPLSLKKPKR